jgi:hypothetical protein
MVKFFGFILLFAGLGLLPIPATLLFGCTYAASLAATAVAVGAGLAVQLGGALIAKG